MWIITLALLTVSNVFMTFAWYGHLKYTKSALWIAILVSWLIALVEYCFQVPANRIGHNAGVSTAQLKTIQEVITLGVFCVFSVCYLKEPLKWNYLLGFCLIALGALFVFAPWQKASPSATASAGHRQREIEGHSGIGFSADRRNARLGRENGFRLETTVEHRAGAIVNAFETAGGIGPFKNDLTVARAILDSPSRVLDDPPIANRAVHPMCRMHENSLRKESKELHLSLYS
jgi:uncharacterized protein (DUF486 family)